MTERWVDLHLHSNRSDGSDAPARVAERAHEAGASAIALTDHDTVAGVAEAGETCASLGVEFLPGVEISAVHDRQELHILGLGIDPDHPELLETLHQMERARETRAERMVRRLNDLGVPVEWEKVRAGADGAIGRMHIASAVVDVGEARTVQEAFDKYIKAGRPAFVPREVLTAARAVESIHAAAGLAFVAHPGLGDTHRRLSSLLQLPFDGIEVYHSRHTPGRQADFHALADERGLLTTGGSDCHGDAKREKPLMGTVRVPYAVYERIGERLASRP